MRSQKLGNRHASPKLEKTRSSAERRTGNRHIEESTTAEICLKEIL